MKKPIFYAIRPPMYGPRIVAVTLERGGRWWGRHNLTQSAIDVVARHMRKETESGGYTRSRYMNDAFGQTIEAIGEMFPDDPFGLDDLEFVLVDELPDDKLTLSESGRMYVHRNLLRRPRREIADQLIRMILDNNYSLDERDLFIGVILDTHDTTRSHRARVDQDIDMSDDEAEAHQEVEELFDPDGSERLAHEEAAGYTPETPLEPEVEVPF